MEQSRVAPVKGGSSTALRIAFVASLVAALGALTLIWQAWLPWQNNARHDDTETLYRVQSRSMEPNYIGPRAVWTCRNCARHFTTSVDLTDAHELTCSQSQDDHARLLRLFERVRVATCPYCGENASSQDARVELGELIDAQPLTTDSTLNRWDAVICREPSGRLTLKRVVGLPNERVSILNGDVFVNGERAARDLDAMLATASRLDSIEPYVSWQRLDFVNVVYPQTVRRGQGKRVAISNESATPCANGNNVAQVEFVRDFILTFEWLAQDARAVKLAILARRPDAAYLIDYDQSRRRLTISALTLYNGQTIKAKRFERLERADFQSADATILYDVALPEYDATRQTLGFELALIDGLLILRVDQQELARVELPDARSNVAVGITEPFAILGAPERVGRPVVYRDLHYSLWQLESVAYNHKDDARVQTMDTPLGREIQLADDRVFTLGDNSPASLDCRFLPDYSIAREAIVARVNDRTSVATTQEREEDDSER
ncbi:MAG: S26 family signal peptidase [Planctomycetia bacterium]|nr:S26 family signal peptidase [Planctomycetia bacterium]